MRPSPAQRFKKYVEPEPNSGCWLWSGLINPSGYGRISVNGRMWLAHRWGYEYFRHPIADGLQLDHLCRVRSCVNPFHLRPVTTRENLLAPGSLAIPKKHAMITHCPRGHSYSGLNLWLHPSGSRRCRECHSADTRERHRRKAKERALARV